MRLDADIVDWFKSQGKGYQTRMNAVLRAYYESRKTTSVSSLTECAPITSMSSASTETPALIIEVNSVSVQDNYTRLWAEPWTSL